MKQSAAQTAIHIGFTVAVRDFVTGSIQQMLPWLIVMFSVIICDLAAGCRKSYLMGDPVRFSRAFRQTMGKMITYFSFVVMVVFINMATAGNYAIDKWAVLFICFIEMCSIIGNLLKPKGYNINMAAVVGMLLKKLFSIDREDSKDVITKDDYKKQ